MRPKHFSILLFAILNTTFSFGQTDIREVTRGRLEPQFSLLKRNIKTAEIEDAIQYYDIDEGGNATDSGKNNKHTYFRFYPHMVIDSIFHAESKYSTRIKCGKDGKIIDRHEQFTNFYSEEHHSGDTVFLGSPKKRTIKTFDKQGHLLTSITTNNFGTITNKTERKTTKNGMSVEESIDYSSEGNLLGKQIKTYGNEDHIQEVLIFQGSDELTERISFSYDPNGNLQQSVDNKAAEVIEETFSYDEQGRETSHFKWITTGEKSSNIIHVMTQYDKSGNTICDEYDSNNKIISSETTSPDGKRLHLIRYNPDGSIQREEKRAIDAQGFDVVTTTEPGNGNIKKTKSIFNNEGELVKRTDINENGEEKIIFERIYNEDGTSTSTEHLHIRGGEESTITHYDRWGNVTQKKHTIHQARIKTIETTIVRIEYYGEGE